MSKVIEPLTKKELQTLFDQDSINVMEFFLKELLLTIPEVLPEQDDVPIYMPQEYVEQWFVQALGAKPVGAGSYPIDILKEGEYAADIKSLTYKTNNKGEISNSHSGEASLGQKFVTDNEEATLDQLFSQGKGEEILDLWKVILRDKYHKIQNEENLIPLYFFFILRGELDFYLVAAKINPDNLNDLSVDKITKDSVFVKDYLDKDYGNCKIYKAKKRMELRLRPKKWIEDGRALKFNLNKDRIEKNLRLLSQKGELDNYLFDKFTFVKRKDNMIE